MGNHSSASQDATHPTSDPSAVSLEPRPAGDPVVRAMTWLAVGLVVLFLASVVGVLLTGVAAPTGPRSAAERELIIASARARGAAGDAAAPYVNALVATGNLSAARIALLQARSGDSTVPVPGLDLAEARMMSVREDYAKAIVLADKAMQGYKAKHDARVALGGDTGEAAKRAGYGEDYYNAALVKAYACGKANRWKDAVEAFDIFLEANPTASDIYIDRGNAKIELGDTAGAEKDFREALKYTPQDEAAKAGLQTIGVAQ